MITVDFVKRAVNGGFEDRVIWTDFRIEESNQNIVKFSGEIYQSFRDNNDFNSWIVEYESPAFEGTTMLNISTQTDVGTGNDGLNLSPYIRSWSLDVDVQSPTTNNRQIALETVELFSTPITTGCYLTGRFIATTVDGSRLEVDAATANNATFYLDAIVNGQVFRQELFWSEHVQSNDVLTDACS